MTALRALRPVLPILVGASLRLSLSMGLRQSLGIFMPAPAIAFLRPPGPRTPVAVPA